MFAGFAGPDADCLLNRCHEDFAISDFTGIGGIAYGGNHLVHQIGELGVLAADLGAVQQQGLDALIITGANVTQPDLAREPFWKPLNAVIDWAYENVTSTLCSCLATHAVLQMRYGQKRRPMGFKRWGVYPHRVVERRDILPQLLRVARTGQHRRVVFGPAGYLEALGGASHAQVADPGRRVIHGQRTQHPRGLPGRACRG